MRRQSPLLIAAIAACFVILAGCHPQQPFYFHEDKDLSHYKGMATEIEYPDVDSCTLGDVEGAIRPFSLQNNQPKEVWDLKLEEAVRIALTNNKIMRTAGAQLIAGPTGQAIQNPPDFLTRTPQFNPSIYDPAIVESDPRSGVEAALSAFDTQFSTSMIWDKNDVPNKSIFFGTFVQQDDLGTFQAQLQKTNATGGTTTIRHNVQYDFQKNSAFPSQFNPLTNWNVNLEAEIRQPLLRGAGVGFNRIAGPGAQPGLYNGVILARIRTDIALTEFEANVRNLVSDVEIAYWELYFNYRSLDAVIAGRESALQTWRRVYTLYKLGAKGGEAEKEAQARENYFLFRTAVEQSLNALYNTEANLRYLLGIAATDGRLIQPIDEPTTAKIAFDWYDAHAEAMARNVELRQFKWVVKQRELELIASKNFLLPQLDAVGRYRWRGLGDQLITSSGGTGDINAPFGTKTNAYQSMTHGDYQEWEMGLQFNMPIGFRREMSGVRNAQLLLAKERAKLQEAELEVSHQLASAIRAMEAHQVLCQTNFNRRIAAQREVEAVSAAYETGSITFDVVLNSQQRLAQAESDYYRSVVDYNKAITQVHFRKGSLLEYNGVYLAEGPWPGKAYFDANRRARARDAAIYMDYGFTQPKVLSRGPYEQQVHGGLFGNDAPNNPNSSQPEIVPTPEPQPIDPGPMPNEPTPAMPQEPTPATPQDPKPQAEAGATALKAPIKKSTTIEVKPETAITASVWKAAPKTATKPAVQTAGYQLQKSPLPPGVATNVAPGGAELSGFATTSDSITPTTYESRSNPSTVESNQPASGWKRISR